MHLSDLRFCKLEGGVYSQKVIWLLTVAIPK